MDSQDTTIAVNFWWQSAVTKSLQPHMHQYYLRHLLDSLLDRERHKVLAAVVPHPQVQALQDSSDSDSGPGQSDATSATSSSAASDSAVSAVASLAGSAAESLSPSSAATTPHTIRATASPDRSLQHEGGVGTDSARQLASGSGASEAFPAVSSPPAQANSHSVIGPTRHRKRKAADQSEAALGECATGIKRQSGSATVLHAAPGQEIDKPSLAHATVGQCHTSVTESAMNTSAAADRPAAHIADASLNHSTEVRMPVHTAALQLLANAVADGLAGDDDAGQLSAGRTQLVALHSWSCAL